MDSCKTMKRIILTLIIAFTAPLTCANEIATDSKTAQIKPTFELLTTNTPAPRPAKKWDRILPFYGEEVVMNGYDLPLPFGISVIYATAQQDMTLTDLSISFKDSRELDLDFISFDNTISNTKTPQLKLDAWVLPFMNVFATFGKVTGTANISFAIDGYEVNDVEANISGMSYSTGVVFVGGWSSYFILLPVSLTWTDMDRNDSDSYTVNVSPRIGKKFPFNNGSRLSLYTGVSYLNSQQTLSGSQTIGGTDETFNYTINQENIDKWMGIVGGSYSLGKHWMLAFEYGGLDGGNRQQFISNLTYRY